MDDVVPYPHNMMCPDYSSVSSWPLAGAEHRYLIVLSGSAESGSDMRPPARTQAVALRVIVRITMRTVELCNKSSCETASRQDQPKRSSEAANEVLRAPQLRPQLGISVYHFSPASSALYPHLYSPKNKHHAYISLTWPLPRGGQACVSANAPIVLTSVDLGNGSAFPPRRC